MSQWTTTEYGNIPDKWEFITASEYCIKVTDGTHDSPKQQNIGKHLITSKHIKGRNIDFDNAYLISQDDYNKINERSKIDQWDVIISMIGEYCGFAYIERNSHINYAVKNVGIFKTDDEIKAFWLYYYIQSAIGRNILVSSKSGTSQPYITLGTLREYPILIPNNINEQKAIAAVLSSLDDKIDLLHRQNATLEKLAETLFRYWFIEEAKEKWEEGLLSDLIIIKYGKDHKKLSDGIIPVFGSGGIMRYADTALYEKESVLIPRKGSLNNVLYFDEPFWTVDTMFYTIMKKPNTAKFIYFFVKELDLASMNVGSAVPSMTTDLLNNIPMSIPSDTIFELYENTVQPFFEKIKTNTIQIRTLTQLRDTLIPKLMSGEVRVKY